MNFIRSTFQAAFPTKLFTHGSLRPRQPKTSPWHSFVYRVSSTTSDDINDLKLWGEAASKYRIHPETRAYGRKLREMGVRNYGDIPVEQLRGQALRVSEALGGVAHFEGMETGFVERFRIRDEMVPVPMTVYKPRDVMFIPVILIYFHGGGLVTGSRNTHATMLKTIARLCNCVVVSVEYRLAPEYKLLDSVADAYCVTDWISKYNKKGIGGHMDSPVGVGGDDCGALLAAIIAHTVHGLDFQILIDPIADFTMAGPSFTEFANTPGMNTTGLKWLMSQFLGTAKPELTEAIWFRPFVRPDLHCLPPSLFVVSQLGPLRDHSLAYHKKMTKAGVSTELVQVNGAPHSFFSLPDHFWDLAVDPYMQTVNFIRQFQ
ncbi:carboxylesterase NlhH-like [Babylonia areolata]|uniref:carboxylesterase NlhH-like n=1 Tax=Babylonia areolata TaxID=304850 RepID=UPI003FD117ED